MTMIDRPTEDGFFCVLICCTRSAAVCEFLSVLYMVFRISTGSVLSTRGRGKPGVTSQFDSSTSLTFCISWSVDIFCLSLSVQKLLNIFVLACNSHRP
jgi:hypothetical protein